MTRVIGAVAGLALAGLSTGALAHGRATGGTGGAHPVGSHCPGGAASQFGARQIQGPVLKSSDTAIVVLNNGAAVSLNVATNTRFDNVHGAQELKEGDQVRATFNVREGANQLLSVTKVGGGSAMGGTAGSAGGPRGGHGICQCPPSGTGGSATLGGSQGGSGAAGTYGGSKGNIGSQGSAQGGHRTCLCPRTGTAAPAPAPTR